MFYILFFFVPLILWPYTSELFEYNKMVFVYFMTTIIMAVWLIRCLVAKKFIFRRTILDWVLLSFLGTQLLSALFSIDPRTSWFGYYSRFNGGFLSTLCYSLLYWAFVSNMDHKNTLSAIRYMLYAAVLVCMYGVLEHFGIDKDIWVQDVQNRVFSTLGQPNWLAGWITALVPLTWVFTLNSKLKTKNPWLYLSLSGLFFLTLLYTKSRSGLLGFAVADIIFWVGAFIIYNKEILKNFFISHLVFAVIILIVSTPWTYPGSLPAGASAQMGPALETGGTESGVIRKIVWKGALSIWRHYPIFGSGVETFAYSYYQFRPIEHNLVSEWDFLYNKAHNEYLNFAATTGSLGIMSYLILIGFCIYLFIKTSKNGPIPIALLAGYASILVSNFFGFSVVPTQLQLFLFPAIAFGLTVQSTKYEVQSKNKILIFLILCTMFYVLCTIFCYWFSDILFTKGKALNDSQNYLAAQKVLEKAIKLNPKEAIFHNEISTSYTGIALLMKASKIEENITNIITTAIDESDKAVALSPANLNLLRTRTTLFLRLSIFDPKYLIEAKNTLLTAMSKAPTDAKIYYNLALTYVRLDEVETAIKLLDKTIELKPNYKDARYLYALLLIDKKDYKKAKEELSYILARIDPNDENARLELEKLK